MTVLSLLCLGQWPTRGDHWEPATDLILMCTMLMCSLGLRGAATLAGYLMKALAWEPLLGDPCSMALIIRRHRCHAVRTVTQ